MGFFSVKLYIFAFQLLESHMVERKLLEEINRNFSFCLRCDHNRRKHFFFNLKRIKRIYLNEKLEKKTVFSLFYILNYLQKMQIFEKNTEIRLPNLLNAPKHFALA